MKLKSVGSVIAERKLTLSGRSTVSVLIGKPEPFPDGNGYSCPYQIVGLGGEQIRRAGGDDTVQALLLGSRPSSRTLRLTKKKIFAPSF